MTSGFFATAAKLRADLASVVAGLGAELIGYLSDLSGAVRITLARALAGRADLALWGVRYDGSDETAEVMAAVAGIGAARVTLIVSGPVKISGNVTFGGGTELSFTGGGMIVGTAGTEVVQIQRQIVAGRCQIFSSCAPIATTAQTCMPEWFGALGNGAHDDYPPTQDAVNYLKNTGGTVHLGDADYLLSNNINIGTALVGSVGQNTKIVGAGANRSAFVRDAAAGTGLQILGAAGTPLAGIELEGFRIKKSVASTGGVGLYAQYTSILKIKDVRIDDYLIGASFLRATNTIAERVLVTFSGTANNWRGFDLDGGGTGAGGNASSTFDLCWVDGSAASGAGGIGFNVHGAYVSDLLFDRCETASAPIGISLDCTASAVNGNEDVQIRNCRADQFTTYGVYIDGAGSVGSPDSMITIEGGWLNPRATGAETVAIYLNNSRGVAITAGAQVYADANYANAYGVKATACANVTIDGSVMFRDQKYGVHLTGCGYSQISGNFYNQSGRGATAHVYGVGCARVMAARGVYDGYATNAISFDATSDGCGIVANVANVANIPTRFSNAGTNAVGGANGATGLNSGV